MALIILAAGSGVRLRPVTADRPKCLTPLAGRTLLARQLDAWRRCGVEDIAVVTGYRADRIVPDGFRCFQNARYESTNMVTSLFCAESAMADGRDVLIAYGDVVFEQRLGRALLEASHPVSVLIDTGWRALWELRMEDPLADAETLKLTPEGHIRELGLKPSGYADIEGQYIGLIKVRRDFVGRFREAYHTLLSSAHERGLNIDNMYMTAFLQHLIDSGWQVGAALVHHGWLELDSLSELHRYEQLWRSGELRRLCNLDEGSAE
jgi:choline kinase